MGSFLRDVLEACRALRREPAVASTVVLMLGAAIGASVVAFAVLNALFIRPLRVRDPQRLVVLWEEDLAQDRHLMEVSFRNFLDWRARSTSFENMAAVGSHDWTLVLLAEGEPARISYRAVAASFFDTLGAEPLLGRTFVPEDDEPGAPRVVVLSHGLWQRRLGGDPGVIGRALRFETARGEESLTVVGVMPEGFRFPSGSQLWAPAGREISEIQSLQGFSDERMRWIGVFHVVGRLNPGATVEQADARDGCHHRESRRCDRSQARRGPDALRRLPLRTNPHSRAGVHRGRLDGRSHRVRQRLEPPRVPRHRSTTGVRHSSRPRREPRFDARILFAESMLLSFGGAALGLSLAIAGVDFIVGLAPSSIPQLSKVPIDIPVLAFAMFLGVATGILSSVLPIVRIDSSARRRLAAGGGLVVWQTALSVVVLGGAGLAGKSFFRLSRADLGFEPKGVVSFSLSPSDVRYSDDGKRRHFYSELLHRLEAVPGVEAAGAILVRPYRLGAIGQDGFLLAEGQSEEESRKTPSSTGKSPRRATSARWAFGS